MARRIARVRRFCISDFPFVGFLGWVLSVPITCFVGPVREKPAPIASVATHARSRAPDVTFSIVEDRFSMIEDRSPTAEDRSPTAEDRSPTTKNRCSTTEDRRSMTEDRRSTTEDRRSMAENRCSMSENCCAATEVQFTPRRQSHGTMGLWGSESGRVVARATQSVV
jgi:hypothetical protein